MKGAFTELKDLHDWFMDVPQNEGKYVLYHGTVARANGNNSMRCLYNDDEKLGVQEAWDQIKSFLSKSRGGEYTILVKEGHKNTGPRAFYDQTGKQPGKIGGYGGSHAAFGGVEEYIQMRLKIRELEQRLEENEPQQSFLERVFSPDVVQDMIMGFLPSMQQGKAIEPSGEPAPIQPGLRDEKIQRLVDSINGLSEDQLDTVMEAINNPAIINMLKKSE